MLTREERRMVAAITVAAMAVSVASAVSIVRNLTTTQREETHIYLPQTADTALSQSYRSPVCTPLVIQCGGGTGRSDAAESGTVVSDPVLLYIAEIPLSGELQEVMQDAGARTTCLTRSPLRSVRRRARFRRTRTTACAGDTCDQPGQLRTAAVLGDRAYHIRWKHRVGRIHAGRAAGRLRGHAPRL